MATVAALMDEAGTEVKIGQLLDPGHRWFAHLAPRRFGARWTAPDLGGQHPGQVAEIGSVRTLRPPRPGARTRCAPLAGGALWWLPRWRPGLRSRSSWPSATRKNRHSGVSEPDVEGGECLVGDRDHDGRPSERRASTATTSASTEPVDIVRFMPAAPRRWSWRCSTAHG